MKFKRLCVGLNDPGKLLPKDEVHDHVTEADKDYYVSLFDYTEEHLARFKDTGSVAGIVDVDTNTLVFDFDSETDVQKAKTDALELCSRLAANGLHPDDAAIFFSGKKGFTIEIVTQHTFTPSEVKKLCLNLGKGLTTLDTQIYNASRIIRIPFTKHPKSGLYKIALTLDELSNLSMEQIKAYAAEGASSVESMPAPVVLPGSIVALKDKETNPVFDLPSEDLPDLDLSAKPKNMPACKFALLHGYFKPGQRSQALMALAAHFKAQGYPKEVTYRLLKGARELNEARYPSSKDSDTANKEYIWNNIIEQVYSPNWKGATYACKDHAFLQENCPVRGTSKCGVNKKEPVVSISDVSSIFTSYAKNIDKNTIKCGIAPIDDQLRLQANSHVVIAGCSGAGKTTLVLNILNHLSLTGSKALFGSMDMGSPLVYQKLAHKVTGLDDKRLYELYKNNSPKVAQIDKDIAENYKNVFFDFRSGVDFEELRENLLRLKDKHPDTLKLAVYDFINRIRGPYSDETANLSYIAPRLADLANETDTLVISLAQIARAKGGPATVLQDSRVAKGSSAIEESASAVLGIWRPGYNTDQDKFLTIAALKTRMGKEFVQPLYWNGLTGEIRELSPDEEFELEQLEESKKDEKASSYD